MYGIWRTWWRVWWNRREVRIKGINKTWWQAQGLTTAGRGLTTVVSCSYPSDKERWLWTVLQDGLTGCRRTGPPPKFIPPTLWSSASTCYLSAQPEAGGEGGWKMQITEVRHSENRVGWDRSGLGMESAENNCHPEKACKVILLMC